MNDLVKGLGIVAGAAIAGQVLRVGIHGALGTRGGGVAGLDDEPLRWKTIPRPKFVTGRTRLAFVARAAHGDYGIFFGDVNTLRYTPKGASEPTVLATSRYAQRTANDEFRKVAREHHARQGGGVAGLGEHHVPVPRPFTSAVKTKVNTALTRAGLDGTRYFRSIAQANNALADVLDQHGFIAPDLPHHYYGAPSGRATFSVERTADAEELRKTMLVYSWHKMQSGNYEVIAYLS